MARAVPPIAELRKICQPADLDVSLYRRLVVRRVSVYFTSIFLRIGASANAVSVAKGVAGIAGALMFTGRSTVWPAAGVLLLQLSYMLDASDGEVARFTGTCSRTGGEFIDKLGDAVSRSLFLLCWGIGAWRLSGSTWPLLAGALMSGLWVVHRFCLVETLLECIANRPGGDLTPVMRERLSRVFVRAGEKGRAEFLLSALYHPLVNLITVFVVAEAVLPAPRLAGTEVHIRLLGIAAYGSLWLLNILRKTFSWFRLADLERNGE